MGKTIRLSLLAALIAAATLPAWADEAGPGGRWTLTPTLGLSLAARLGSLVPLPNTADVPGVEFSLERRGPEAGLWLGYRLGRGFEIQAGASRGRSGIYEDVGIGFAGIPLGKSLFAHAVVWTAGARLLYVFGAGAFEPYVAAGFGVTTMDTGELGSKTRPAVEIGAGVRARLTNRLKAVFEIRDAVTFFRYFEDFRVAYIMIYTAETAGVQHRVGARLGLSVGF
jgi:opacity protein-like surface antigen